MIIGIQSRTLMIFFVESLFSFDNNNWFSMEWFRGLGRQKKLRWKADKENFRIVSVIMRPFEDFYRLWTPLMLLPLFSTTNFYYFFYVYFSYYLRFSYFPFPSLLDNLIVLKVVIRATCIPSRPPWCSILGN